MIERDTTDTLSGALEGTATAEVIRGPGESTENKEQ